MAQTAVKQNYYYYYYQDCRRVKSPDAKTSQVNRQLSDGENTDKHVLMP